MTWPGEAAPISKKGDAQLIYLSAAQSASAKRFRKSRGGPLLPNVRAALRGRMPKMDRPRSRSRPTRRDIATAYQVFASWQYDAHSENDQTGVKLVSVVLRSIDRAEFGYVSGRPRIPRTRLPWLRNHWATVSNLRNPEPRPSTRGILSGYGGRPFLLRGGRVNHRIAGRPPAQPPAEEPRASRSETEGDIHPPIAPVVFEKNRPRAQRKEPSFKITIFV